jgi:hypothetical protein
MIPFGAVVKKVAATEFMHSSSHATLPRGLLLDPSIGLQGLAVEATLLSGCRQGVLDLVKALGVALSIVRPHPLWCVVRGEASILLS